MTDLDRATHSSGLTTRTTAGGITIADVDLSSLYDWICLDVSVESDTTSFV
jgi:hypothetical protein